MQKRKDNLKNKTISSFKNTINPASVEAFIKGASTNTTAVDSTVDDNDIDKLKQLNPKVKANRAFTVPLNEYDLTILRFLSHKQRRSQRTITSWLLSKALRNALQEELSGTDICHD